MTEQALLSDLEQRFQSFTAELKRLPIDVWRSGLIAIALFWAVYSLSNIVWVIFPAPTLPNPPVLAVQSAESGTQATRKNVDLASLQSLQIFGEPGADAPVVEEVVETPIATGIEDDAAKTALNLTLVGVMVQSVAKNSNAVIAQSNKQKIYTIGDKMPAGNNVTLAKILNDRVILNNNGRYESLWLYSEADFKLSVSRRQTSTAPKRPINKVQTKIRPADIPKSISDVVRFSVHREEGQMVGFRIRPGKNRDLFERLGLRANDVVTSVNGIPIDNAQAIRDNYQQLKSATAADLEIKRGEETVYVNVSLDTTSE